MEDQEFSASENFHLSYLLQNTVRVKLSTYLKNEKQFNLKEGERFIVEFVGDLFT